MTETVYLNISQISEIHSRDVYLSDVAQLWCKNTGIAAKCKAVKIMTVRSENNCRLVGAALDIIELLENLDPKIQVNNIGETEFIVDYQKQKKPNYIWQWTKTIIVCIICFFGAAFAIMTFNNDASVTDVFSEVYMAVMGTESNGFTIIEICYSIGLGLGILLFFNHFAGKKITTDPTPIEVEMRLYEENVNKTLIQNNGRKESGIDVT